MTNPTQSTSQNSTVLVDISTLDPTKTVVVATGNAHKVTEIEAILQKSLPDVHFVALGELGSFDDPEETGETFTQNAFIKAQAALAATGLTMAVADDSGLCVDALDGAPGIYSARYAGEHGNDHANNLKLLEALKDTPKEERTAHFHSSVVFIERDEDGEEVLVGEGECPGLIGFEPKGEHGFGYDPLFLPKDAPGKTMAELLPQEKNEISHRFHALQDLAQKL